MTAFFDLDFFKNLVSDFLANILAASIGIYMVRLILKRFVKSKKLIRILEDDVIKITELVRGTKKKQLKALPRKKKKRIARKVK